MTLGLHTYLDISSLKNVELSGAFSGVSTLDRNTGTTGTMNRCHIFLCHIFIRSQYVYSSALACSDRFKIDKATDLALRKFNGPITVTDTGKGTKVTVSSKGYQGTYSTQISLLELELT